MRKKIIFAPFFGLAFVAGLPAVVMLLWNVLVPQIFGLAVINFWQALGLFVLCKILFGFGFGGAHFGHKHAHRNFESWGHKNPLREKWEKMTPEERKEFIKGRHFGRGFDCDFFKQTDNTEK